MEELSWTLSSILPQPCQVGMLLTQHPLLGPDPDEEGSKGRSDTSFIDSQAALDLDL